MQHNSKNRFEICIIFATRKLEFQSLLSPGTTQSIYQEIPLRNNVKHLSKFYKSFLVPKKMQHNFEFRLRIGKNLTQLNTNFCPLLSPGTTKSTIQVISIRNHCRHPTKIKKRSLVPAKQSIAQFQVQIRILYQICHKKILTSVFCCLRKPNIPQAKKF